MDLPLGCGVVGTREFRPRQGSVDMWICYSVCGTVGVWNNFFIRAQETFICIFELTPPQNRRLRTVLLENIG